MWEKTILLLFWCRKISIDNALRCLDVFTGKSIKENVNRKKKSYPKPKYAGIKTVIKITIRGEGAAHCIHWQLKLLTGMMESAETKTKNSKII